MKAKNWFEVETLDEVKRFYLLEIIFLEQSLNIKDFKDRAVSSQGKEVSTTRKLTCSDGFLIGNCCQFTYFTHFKHFALP